MSSKEEEKDLKSGWLPLESNPALLNKFNEKMGVADKIQWGDVYGLTDDMLEWVAKPVLALTLLFPITKNNIQFKKQQKEKIDKDGGQMLSKKLFYLTQLDGFGNACGTIACIHALANNEIKFEDDSPLKHYISKNLENSAKERGENLLRAKGIRKSSEKTAQSTEASTRCPDRTERLNAHFITFVNVEDSLYELDGRKAFPINHGKTSKASFLKDAATVIREKFMKLDPENGMFNVMALSKVT